jgi:dipeptidyl aminopeptidase/acylaminoacyl peptidase
VGRGLRDEVELRVIGADGAGDRLVSQFAAPIDFARSSATATEITWPGAGGLEMNGLLFTPTTASPDVPLLVDLHGGPMGGTMLGSSALTTGSTAEWWYWTTLGYAVFVPNDRRNNLHGVGPWWSMVERGDTTTEPIEDVLTGIDAVVARGGVDADRVGVLGHSAGAVLAFQLHARHSDRFRFVVAKGGYADLGHFASLAGPDISPCSQYPIDIPDCDRFVERNSALPFVDRATAPLLVPSGGAEEALWPADYVAALRAVGHDVTEVVYDDELHDIRLPDNQRDLLALVTEFAAQHLADR